MLLKCHLVLAIAHFRPSKLSSSLEECLLATGPGAKGKSFCSHQTRHKSNLTRMEMSIKMFVLQVEI